MLIFAIAAVLIYKLFGGRLPTFGKSPHEKKLEDDTLVECDTCHTYVTVKESIIVGGKYYCSRECVP
ncbi:PP0621 family protein [Sulfurovum sp.]|uniref:PP0621 family protein n=1 Tax=Sulfurovum sp. TaxID=1969726 RepID=UPI002F9528A5